MPTSHDLAGNPPESTCLRIGEDIPWSDISNVYDRDDSLKENTNPKCFLKNHPGYHGGGGGGGGGTSQRFSGNLKPTAAPIIRISGKLGQAGGGCSRRHPPPAMFLKKASTAGGGRNRKPALPDHEPGSPKVSCIGKVLSERERERARRRRPARTARSPEMRSGCCGGFGFLFRRSRSRKGAVECIDQSPPPPPAARERREADEMKAVAAPALGGMKRFASGRRAVDWAARMELDECVARSGPL